MDRAGAFRGRLRGGRSAGRVPVHGPVAGAGLHDSFTHKVTPPAWKAKPAWYMVATADRSINPDRERRMAKRAKAKAVEVNASHVTYMSHPKETARLIEEAATSAQVNQ